MWEGVFIMLEDVRGDEVNLRENVGQKFWETVYVGRDSQ